MKRTLVLLIFLLCFNSLMKAQSLRKIILFDTIKKKVFANAELWFKDSAGTLELRSNNQGVVWIPDYRNVNFSLKIYTSETDTLLFENLKLTPNDSLLLVLNETFRKTETVDITANQKAITFEGEKMVVSASSMGLGAAANLLDLLQRMPSVLVDEQNNSIQLRGKAGVMFMFDGRLRPFSGAELIQICKSTPAMMVEKIELILNPSARYDAAGNAGIINVVFKKEKNQGWNMLFTTGVGKGWYGKQSDGIALNYRKQKFNVFSGLNYSYWKAFNKLDLIRKFYRGDSLTGGYNQQNYLLMPHNIGNARAGFDYFIDKKNTIGVTITAGIDQFNPHGNNNSDILNNQAQTASYFTTANNSHDKWYNYSAGANYKRLLDTFGSEFSTDIDFAEYGNVTDQLFTTQYLDLNHQPSKPDYLLFGDIAGGLKIRAIKADYVNKKLKKIQLETGIKSSLVNSDNDMKYYDKSNAQPVMDSAKSNNFVYSENINAAYINMLSETRGYSWQLGFRAEQTIAEGHQLYTGEKFNRNYAQLFPSFNVQKAFSQNHVFTFAFNRRLDRPGYRQLNPFKFYLDPTTYRAGNPYLNPQFTWNTNITHIFKSKLINTFSASRTFKNITEVVYPSEADPKVTIQTDKNIYDYSELYHSITYQYQFFKRWSGMVNVLGFYGYYRGYIANTNLNKGNLGFNISTTQNVKIKDNWSLDANLQYNSGMLYGYMWIRPVSQTGMGITHTFMKKKASIKFNISDIFFTQNPKAHTAYVNYREQFIVKRETRVAMITFTYRAGQQLAPNKKRNSGAEDEKRRAASNAMG